MGAADFAQLAWGKDVGDAFAIACDEALWEHGHGGYSGTLAEKHGYVLITLPPRLSVKKYIELVREYQQTHSAEAIAHDLAWQEQQLLTDVPSVEKRAWRSRISETKRRLKRAERTEKAFARKAGQHLALIERSAMIYDDKWGPALAVEVPRSQREKWGGYASGVQKRGRKLFLFCGWASS